MEGDRAAQVSGLIALACFAIAVYVMARCFDLPALPSAVAAQSCIVLFGPLLLLASGTTVFVLEPGFAVVYAPLMVPNRSTQGSGRREKTGHFRDITRSAACHRMTGCATFQTARHELTPDDTPPFLKPGIH